jgi:hypothetical protein
MCVSGICISSGRALALPIEGTDRAKYWTFAARRTLEGGAHFCQVELKFGHRAAQRVAVHAQFFGCLTLIAPVRYQNFSQILPFEVAYRFLIANSA